MKNINNQETKLVLINNIVLSLDSVLKKLKKKIYQEDYNESNRYS